MSPDTTRSSGTGASTSTRVGSSNPAADSGDDDARFVVDGAEGHELLWYASQELPHLAG